MLNQYTWGDFALFVLVVVILYYAGVGLLYYRQELTALITRKGRGGAQRAGAGTAAPAGRPSLVRTTSAFVAATPAATESRAPAAVAADEAGAARNLPATQEVNEVTGSLPDSTSAATGQDDGQDAGAPMDSASGAETAADTAAEYDEQRTEELDQVDTKLAAQARALASEMPTDGSNSEASGIIENYNNAILVIETVSTLAYVEGETAYEKGPALTAEPLYSFDEFIASGADVIPIVTEQLFEARSLLDFIAQAQAGNRPAVPAALQETDLVSRMTDLVAAGNEELNALFGDDEQ